MVKLDSVSDEDAEATAKFVQEKTDKVDVLIANAGESGLGSANVFVQTNIF